MLRRMPLIFLCAFVLRAFLFPMPAHADVVITADIDRAITPVTAEYVERVLREAKAANAKAVLFRLDTPGGLLESTRQIVAAFLQSDIPILVWIGPGGARAASAGVFITYAAHVSAMAHGTHMGAAHPVMLGGGEMDTVMKQKVENDAVAWARTIAETRKRNVRFAELAVRESMSLTDQAALDSGVVDLHADDIDSFLAQIAGETTSLSGVGPRRVAMAFKSIVRRDVPPKFTENVRAFLTDPNVVYVLILLAMAGLYFELSTPGIGAGGVIGVICIILAAYGLSILPVNAVGLILMGVGILLMILDVKLVSHGILTIGGIVAMAIGGIMLFEDRAFAVSLQVVLFFTGLTAAFVVFAVGTALRSLSGKVRMGQETLAGHPAESRTEINPEGVILLDGEIWTAISEDGSAIPPRTPVCVVRKTGAKLIVRKIERM